MAIGGNFCQICGAWKGQLGLECVSEDTEIYTINGWKTIDTISLSDKILTFNLLNEKLYYHRPYKINKYDYNGDMFLIETKHTSQLVTPNHRTVVKYIADYKQWKGKKQYKDGKIGIERYWHFVEAKDLTPHDGIVLPLAGNFECENDELNISKHLNAVIGWIISEGHDGSKKGRQGYTIVQSLTVNRENVEQIRTDLNNADVKHTEHLRKNKRDKKEYVYFYIGKRSGWYQKIKNIIPNKEITPSLLNQPIDNLKALYDRLMRGDGYRLKDCASEVFGQKRNTDTSNLFDILAVKIGKRAIEGRDIHKRNMRVIHTNDRNFTIIYPQYFNDSNFYIENGKKQKRMYYRAFKKVDYNGRVWCPSVPNGAFVARRKGKVFITGNSHPQMYIDHLVEVFREVKRVLKKSGSFYLNIGDTYGTHQSGGKNSAHNFRKSELADKIGHTLKRPRNGFSDNFIMEKNLLMIPSRIAIALQDDGWILRNLIIWQKPNPMPSSVKNRLNNTYEHVFHFVKNNKPIFYYNIKTGTSVDKKPSELKEGIDWGWKDCQHCTGTGRVLEDTEALTKESDEYIEQEEGEKCNKCKGSGKIKISYWKSLIYHYDLDAIRIPHKEGVTRWGGNIMKPPKDTKYTTEDRKTIYCRIDEERLWRNIKGKNPGDVLTVTTRPFKGSHFAVFPEELLLIPLKSSCPTQICKKCGKPRIRINKRTGEICKQWGERKSKPWFKDKRELPQKKVMAGIYETVGWSDCNCNADFSPGVVLDPFGGRGTVAKVARQLGLNWIIFDIKPEYCEMANLYIYGQQRKVHKNDSKLTDFL